MEEESRVVVTLIDHTKYNNTHNNNDLTNSLAASYELLLKNKFAETSLDFLHKETLIYIAKKYDRPDFVSLFPLDRKFVLSLIKNNESADYGDYLDKVLVALQDDLTTFSVDDENLVAYLLINDYLNESKVNKRLLESNNFLHQVAEYDYFLYQVTDKDFAIQLIMDKPKRYKRFHSILINDRDVARVAFSKKGSYITKTNFLNDRELLLTALKSDGSVYKSISDDLKKDWELIELALKTYSLLFDELDHSFFTDEFSERALKLKPKAFKIIPQKKELDFVKRVLTAELLPYLKTVHLQDKEIRAKVESFLVNSNDMYFNFSPDLRKDKELALKALDLNPAIISRVLIEDYDCYKLAISKDAGMIRHCPSQFLVKHYDLVDLALSSNPNAFHDLPLLFKDDPIYVMKMVEKFPSLVSIIDKKLLIYVEQNNSDQEEEEEEDEPIEPQPKIENILELSKKQAPATVKQYLDFTPVDFSNIKPFSLDTTKTSFVFQAFNQTNTTSSNTTTNTNTTNNTTTKFAGFGSTNPFANKNPLSKPILPMKRLTLEEEINQSNDKTFLKQKLEKDPFLFRYCNDNVKKDREFILDMMKNTTGAIFQFVDQSLREDKEFVLQAIPISVAISKFIDPKFKSDKEVISKALKVSPIAHAFFDSSVLYGDQDIAYKVVKSNPITIKNIHIRYFRDRKFVSQLFKLMFRKKRFKNKHSKKVKPPISNTLQ